MKTKLIDDFGILILTHKRANNVVTLKTLEKCGYDGRIIIVIDNTDPQRSEYEKIPNVEIVVFNKIEAMKMTDTCDNFKDTKLVVYARNKTWEIAKEKGLKYFLVLDDDYSIFNVRYEKDNKLKHKQLSDINKFINLSVEFLENTNALTVAWAQGGDFIGGINSGNFKKGLLRKAMNSFFCKVDRPFKFSGSTNEDVNAYVNYGSKGKLLFTLSHLSLEQKQTQSNSGGLTDIYLQNGTYVKSFYSVIHQPSCVSVRLMGNKDMRIHHSINWNYCVPKIISENLKK